MREPFFLLTLVILIGFCLVAFFLILDALFAGLVAGIARSAEEKPGKAFWVGLINLVFLAAVAIGLISLTETTALGLVVAIPGLIISIFVVAGIVLGLGGMMRLIAGLVFPGKDGWKSKASSAGMMTLGCLAPYVGWFGLLPYLGLRGFGAFILHLVEVYRTYRLAKQETSIV